MRAKPLKGQMYLVQGMTNTTFFSTLASLKRAQDSRDDFQSMGSKKVTGLTNEIQRMCLKLAMTMGKV